MAGNLALEALKALLATGSKGKTSGSLKTYLTPEFIYARLR